MFHLLFTSGIKRAFLVLRLSISIHSSFLVLNRLLTLELINRENKNAAIKKQLHHSNTESTQTGDKVSILNSNLATSLSSISVCFARVKYSLASITKIKKGNFHLFTVTVMNLDIASKYLLNCKFRNYLYYRKHSP